MTLDEAIRHAEEVAEEEESYYNQDGFSGRTQKHCECAADHRQLAEWLTELKERRETEKCVR